MTGPEHYREAERLLATGSQAAERRAQVHATLALAAATALPAAQAYYGDESNAVRQWAMEVDR